LSTGKKNSLFVSSISATIPCGGFIPLPISSTTAIRLKLFGRAPGKLTVTVPLSEPPIGISLTVAVWAKSARGFTPSSA
jgi:hypothetical protein